jgi:integrase
VLSDSHESEALPVMVPTGRGHSRQDAMLAVLQQLLGGVAGVPVATAVAKPFQFPSLQHLDERMAATLQHAEQVEGLSAKTTKGYRSAYAMFRTFLREKTFAAPFIGGQLQEQTRVLEEWIAWLRLRGANHTTVNSYWRALHAPFARIARVDAAVDPTRFVATPKPGRPLVKFLPRGALEEVFRFVRNYQWHAGEFERARNVAVLTTMALGGCRKGEVLALDVEDVNCHANTITIEKGKGQHGGKGRIICMPGALNRAMREYLTLRRERDLSTSRLFVSVVNDQPMGDTALRRFCALVSEKSGVHIAPHMLRHTCATLLRQAGVPDRLSMDQLGHSSLAVLQRYSHIAPGERQLVIGRLDFDFGGKT